MKKLWNLILNGYVRLLFPLIICIILIEKLLHILNPIIHQIKDKLHITRWVGVFDVFLISIVLLLILGLLCSLLLKSKFIEQKMKNLEDALLKRIPLYSELKSVLGKETNTVSTDSFLPALLKEDNHYCLCYITDKSEHFYTVVICDNNLHGGELRIAPKEAITLIDIPFHEFARRIRNYGANAANFAENSLQNSSKEE